MSDITDEMIFSRPGSTCFPFSSGSSPRMALSRFASARWPRSASVSRWHSRAHLPVRRSVSP